MAEIEKRAGRLPEVKQLSESISEELMRFTRLAAGMES